MAQGPTNFGNGLAAPYLFLRGMAFARLPANPQFGMQAVVSDSTTVVQGAAITGGGTNRVAAFYNGTNWVVDASVPTLPDQQFTTSAVTVGVIGAGVITGAKEVVWLQTGATPGNQTTRTAAQMLADIPNGAVGMSHRVRICNSGAGTLTVVADASVTLSGAATIAQNTWREYNITFTGAATATMQYVGGGTF